MTREDRVTNTPDDAAAYERNTFGGDIDPDRPTKRELASEERSQERCHGCGCPVTDRAVRVEDHYYCEDCW